MVTVASRVLRLLHHLRRGQCVATWSTGRRVAHGTVLTASDGHHTGDQQDEDQDDDPG